MTNLADDQEAFFGTVGHSAEEDTSCCRPSRRPCYLVVCVSCFLIIFGGCLLGVNQYCVNVGVEAFFLPTYTNNGMDANKYTEPWHDTNGKGPLGYFITQVDSFSPKSHRYPQNSRCEYQILNYTGYQQLINYCIVPQDYMKHLKPKGTMIMLPGWGGYWRQIVNKGYLWKTAQLFRAQGFMLLLVDLRGHGWSEADKPYTAATSYGGRDYDDVRAVVEKLRSTGRLADPLLATGHSYGAPVATALALQNVVTAAISLSGLSTIDNMMQAVRGAAIYAAPELLQQVDFCLAQPFFTSRVLAEAQKRYHFDAKDSSIINMGNLSPETPLLFVASTEDVNVPPNNIEEVVAARDKSTGTRTVLFQGCDHWSYWKDTNFKNYSRSVTDFLNAVMGNAELPKDKVFSCDQRCNLNPENMLAYPKDCE